MFYTCKLLIAIMSIFTVTLGNYFKTVKCFDNYYAYSQYISFAFCLEASWPLVLYLCFPYTDLSDFIESQL